MIKTINELVASDFCTGCGACGVVDEEIKFTFRDDKGLSLPDTSGLTQQELAKASEVCPFLHDNPRYTHFEQNSAGLEYNPLVGYFHKIVVGAIRDPLDRSRSTSGGMTTYVLRRLLEKRLVTGVIHLAQNPNTNGIENAFEYRLSRSIEEVESARGTKYFPGSLKELRHLLERDDESMVIVALPCFIRGIRLLTKNDDECRKKIKYTISLVCGHLKTANFTKYLAINAGVSPNDSVSKIEYREPVPGGNAHDYRASFTVGATERSSEKKHTLPTKELYAENWAYGLSMPNICSFCDDVAGENADLTIGDAWIPPYDSDPRGTNIAIVRNLELLDIIQEQGLDTVEVGVDDFVHSQAGSFRNRREGVLYRSATNRVEIPTTRVSQLKIFDSIEDREYKSRSSVHQALRGHESLISTLKFRDFQLFKFKTFYSITIYQFQKNGIRALLPRGLKKLLKTIMTNQGSSAAINSRKVYIKNHDI